MAASLQARWQAPSPEQKQALGSLIWQEMLATPIEQIAPKESLEATLNALLSEEVTRALWQNLPRELMVADLRKLRHSGLTLGEVLGPEAAALMRKQASGPWKPNRELLERLLDQPLLRQALRNMVQKTMQQFLSQINPLGGPGAGASPQGARGSLLGTMARGLASKAEKAAQIGMTFMEGVGGTLYKQVESQLQPFLTGFMQRSVHLLTEGLFEGDQAKLGAEARLHGLEILLDTPLETLMPPPTDQGVAENLAIGEAIAGHVVRQAGYVTAVRSSVVALYDTLRGESLRELMTRMKLPLEAEPALLEALGQAGYHYLTRPTLRDWLTSELEAVW